jgi:DNA-binding transcriptional regulator YiaG
MSQFPPGWLAHDVALAAAKVAEWKSIKDMTPKQYAAAIEDLGLSQRAAGAFLGVDERTSRRWVLGESAIPESAAKLLRLMVRLKLSPDDVN